MGKPWHGKGKSQGHSGGLGFLHGIARRYQEQRQLSMLGPMLASAGFGQPQGAMTHAFGQPQPQMVPQMAPMMLTSPSAQPMPVTPQVCHQMPPGYWQSRPLTHGIEQNLLIANSTGAGSNDESTSSIMSTLTSLGSSVQKLLAMF